jgi:hypothetical protein
MKKLALFFVLILAIVCTWGLMSSNVTITVNGQTFNGPFETLAGGWGLIISTVALFCVAILLAFILAGVGLIILGVMALTGFILLSVAFPFLLPVLIPLLIVWAFCAGSRKGK